MNEAQISVCGYVAKQPVTKHLAGGKVKTELRVAWTPRWVNKATGEWVDGITSYATVYCWRKLAVYAGISLRKGEPVVVQGRLTIRPYEIDGVRRESVEIEATTIGHDLGHGVANFSRVKPSTGMSAAEYEAAQATGPAGETDGQPAGETDGQPAGEADGQPDGQADGQPDGQADGQPNGQADTQPDGQADGDREDPSVAPREPLLDEAAIERMDEQDLARDDEYPAEPEPGEEGRTDIASGDRRGIGRARKERVALPA